MRIATKVVVDVETGHVIERHDYEYSGPMALAKGGTQGIQNAGLQNLQLNNATAAQMAQQQEALQSQLIPTYTSMLNQGYTPQEKEAMTTSGIGAIGSTYGAATQMAANRAARTRNEAGVAAQEDVLARNKGTATGTEAANLQQQFAQQRLKNLYAGLSGLSNIFGQDISTEAKLYGLGPEDVRAAAAEQAPKTSVGVGPVGFSF